MLDKNLDRIEDGLRNACKDKRKDISEFYFFSFFCLKIYWLPFIAFCKVSLHNKLSGLTKLHFEFMNAVKMKAVFFEIKKK